MTGSGRAMIFDMDGVIVDSEPIHKEADAATFRTIGLEVPVDVLQEYAGTGAEFFFRSILDRFGGRADVADLKTLKNGILADLLRKETPPVPGIFTILDRSRRLGFRLAVASSSDEEIVALVLSRLGIRGRFAAVVGGSGIARGKPAPDIFLETADRLQTSPERCVVVEDSAAGVRAACAAGMTCIGLRNPLSGRQDLSAAHGIVDHLEEIDEDFLMSLTAV